MEGSWVGFLRIQLPRCEGRRALRPLGWTAALVAALLCASAFVATAQAEDPPPPASDGAAPSSDSVPTDSASAASPDSTGTTTDTSATATDATDTSGTTTDTSATATDTSGAAPSDTSSGSDVQASDSTGRAASASTDAGSSTDTPAPADAGASTEAGAPTDAANGSTDPVPPASSPAPAGSLSPTHSPSSSGEAGVPPADSPTSSSPTPEAPSDSTASDFPSDEATTVPVVPTSGLAPEIGAVGVIRWGVDCRTIVVCGLAPLARAPSDSQRVLLGRCPPSLEGRQAEQPGGRTREESGRPYGGQGPRSPRLPAPDHQPQVPAPYGSSLGSGSSEGFHSGAVLGVIAALLSLTSLSGSRLVTLVERRWRALPLVFSLERPG